tara:strand:- start:72 stop:395 length:324 start_codon:yes stop_codon:yes gene_type:complete
VTKEAFAGPHTLPEVLDLISPITLHVFCSVYVPAEELCANYPPELGVPVADGDGTSAGSGHDDGDGGGQSGGAYELAASAAADAADAAEAADAWPGEWRCRPLGDFR